MKPLAAAVGSAHSIQPGIVHSSPDLRYAEFAPDAEAEELIDRFYCLENPTLTPLAYPAVADAGADLLLDLSGLMSGAVSTTLRTPMAAIVPPGVCLLGLRLRPGALQRLPNLQLRAQEGRLKFLGTETDWLRPQRGESMPMLMERLQDRLLALVIPGSADAGYLALHLGRMDSARLGLTPLTQLAADMDLSTRQLHRLSLRHLGLAPAVFVRVRRIQAALQRLAHSPKQSLRTLAADTGFSDQAHMSREFRRLTGYTPGGWRVRFVQDPEPGAAQT